MNTFKTTKGTELPMLNLKGKDYLQVAHRLIWFREEHPDWGIETDVRVEGKSCLATAWIKDPTGRTIAMAHKVEDANGFPDFVEKSSTGAIGRALALCGYGTQFATELEEGERLADAPVARPQPVHTGHLKSVDPIPSVAASNPGTVLVPFGKYKDQPIFQIPMDEVQKDIKYWEGRAASEGKPLGGKVGPYIAACKAFLAQKWGPGALPSASVASATELKQMPKSIEDSPPPAWTESDIPF